MAHLYFLQLKVLRSKSVNILINREVNTLLPTKIMNFGTCVFCNKMVNLSFFFQVVKGHEKVYEGEEEVITGLMRQLMSHYSNQAIESANQVTDFK